MADAKTDCGPTPDPNAPPPNKDCPCLACVRKRAEVVKHPLRLIAADFRKQAGELVTLADGYESLADLSDASPDSPLDKAMRILFDLAREKGNV